jgi:aspartate 1-decarboxylase
MLRTFLLSKIHRAVVTEANLNYEGSLTIDSDLMEVAGISEFELVSVVNINNGERFETYAITGQKGSGVICLNGAAARKAQIDDKLIIMTYCQLSDTEVPSHKPKIIIVDENNQIKATTDKVTAGSVFSI